MSVSIYSGWIVNKTRLFLGVFAAVIFSKLVLVGCGDSNPSGEQRAAALAGDWMAVERESNCFNLDDIYMPIPCGRVIENYGPNSNYNFFYIFKSSGEVNITEFQKVDDLWIEREDIQNWRIENQKLRFYFDLEYYPDDYLDFEYKLSGNTFSTKLISRMYITDFINGLVIETGQWIEDTTITTYTKRSLAEFRKTLGIVN